MGHHFSLLDKNKFSRKHIIINKLILNKSVALDSIDDKKIWKMRPSSMKLNAKLNFILTKLNYFLCTQSYIINLNYKTLKYKIY